MVATTTNNGSEQTAKQPTALTQFSRHMDQLKKQMALVLPKHLSSDRMARLALSAFNGESSLRKCTFESIAAAVLTAAQMGLEIGVGGQGWLVPYGKEATFVPGWMGLVELLNRAGRSTAWTQAVYKGDSFDWQLGDSPFVKHRPSGDKSGEMTHAYAIGRIHGSDWPIIEVWTKSSLEKHRDRYNKVGDRHYSFKDTNNWEMYCRKVALLQVLKYLPKSIELSAAIDASYAADQGYQYTIDGNYTVTTSSPKGNVEAAGTHNGDLRSMMTASQSGGEQPKLTPEEIEANYWGQVSSAGSESICKSLGATIKSDPALTAEVKKKLHRALGNRMGELLMPDEDDADQSQANGNDVVDGEVVGQPTASQSRGAGSPEPVEAEPDEPTEYGSFLARVVETDDPDSAGQLADDIQASGLDASQKGSLTSMLKGKFA